MEDNRVSFEIAGAMCDDGLFLIVVHADSFVKAISPAGIAGANIFDADNNWVGGTYVCPLPTGIDRNRNLQAFLVKDDRGVLGHIHSTDQIPKGGTLVLRLEHDLEAHLGVEFIQ